MATIQVEGVVVVVIAVEHLDTLYLQTVASQIMLHPATAVLQGDIPHGDVLALDKSQQMRPGDTLIIPRQFLESAPATINRSIAVDDHIPHLVGIEQLNCVGLRAQRDIVRFHWPVVVHICTAIERGTML